jgi:cobalamin-dependent methionine synthase I
MTFPNFLNKPIRFIEDVSMLIIAERINSSRKQIAQAVTTGDRTFIQIEAKVQTQTGAHYIDVNAGTFVGEET